MHCSGSMVVKCLKLFLCMRQFDSCQDVCVSAPRRQESGSAEKGRVMGDDQASEEWYKNHEPAVDGVIEGRSKTYGVSRCSVGELLAVRGYNAGFSVNFLVHHTQPSSAQLSQDGYQGRRMVA